MLYRFVLALLRSISIACYHPHLMGKLSHFCEIGPPATTKLPVAVLASRKSQSSV